MSRIKKIIGNNCFVLRLLVTSVPLYVILAILLYIAKGLLQSLSNVWLIESVIDGVLIDKSYESVLLPVIMYCVYAIVIGFLNAAFTEVFEKIWKRRFSDKIHLKLYEIAIKCDIKNYDDSQFYNDYIWAASECDSRAFNVFQTLLVFVHRLTVISSTIAMMSQINGWIMVVVGFCCAVNLIVSLKQSKMQFELAKMLQPLTRKNGYIARIMHLPEYAKELRTSRIYEILLASYENTTDEIEIISKQKNERIWKCDFFKKIVGEDIFIAFISIIILVWQVKRGSITIGGFVASYKGVQVIHTSLLFILGRVASFSEYSLYIEKLKKFWLLKPSIMSAPIAKEPGETSSIEMQNVSFSYELSRKMTLHDISLEFNKPQKIAIVGANGAGKTTLVKLLLRLYDAEQGKVLHNDINIKDLDLNMYRNKFACLFQDFNIYAGTVGENIVMAPSNCLDKNKAEIAMRQSGFYTKFNKLDDKYDTYLSKEFCAEGVLLSGGEKQKLAIARLMYSAADCYILDEPTSALDATSEIEFNKAIMQCSKSKLILIISHRLTVTKLVDKIIVLDGGRICEIGTHSELMKKNGIYANMYNLQASQYSLEDDREFP